MVSTTVTSFISSCGIVNGATTPAIGEGVLCKTVFLAEIMLQRDRNGSRQEVIRITFDAQVSVSPGMPFAEGVIYQPSLLVGILRVPSREGKLFPVDKNIQIPENGSINRRSAPSSRRSASHQCSTAIDR